MRFFEDVKTAILVRAVHLKLNHIFDGSWYTIWQRVNLRPELAAADTY